MFTDTDLTGLLQKLDGTLDLTRSGVRNSTIEHSQNLGAGIKHLSSATELGSFILQKVLRSSR